MITAFDDIIEQSCGHVPQRLELFVMVAELLPFPVCELDENKEEDEDDRTEDGSGVLELSADVGILGFICKSGIEGLGRPVDNYAG